MSGPLEGLRVLDFSWYLAGPYSTMILADLGAEVVKVEAPERGDPTRHVSPLIGNLSAYFESVNRGKRSLCLDLKSEEGRRLAARLAGRADVLVENFTPGSMARLGLDYPAISQNNPRLIYASCSGFGQIGPRAELPAFDGIIQAMAGTMSITGDCDGEPMRVGFSVGDIGGALYLTIGILSALAAREKSGRGQYLDVSMLEAQVALLENAFSRYFATGKIPVPQGSRHPLVAPFQTFETRDGYIVVCVGTEQQWTRFCQVLDREDLASDPRFSHNNKRMDNVLDLDQELTETFMTKTGTAWIELFQKEQIPSAPVQDIAQVAQDPFLQERGVFARVRDPERGTRMVVNSPIRFSETPTRLDSAAPALGECSSDSILERWGATGSEDSLGPNKL